MTGRLYYTDPYQQEFETAIVAVEQGDGRFGVQILQSRGLDMDAKVGGVVEELVHGSLPSRR